MSSLLLVLFLVVVGTAAKRLGDTGDAALHWVPEGRTVVPVCSPFNYSCGPIPPTPPTSYEAHLEHVDLVEDATHYMEEFYDFESNILAVTDSWSGAFVHNIFYFDINTVVVLLTERGREDGRHPTYCTVSEITHKTVFHPVPGVNDTVHLVFTPSQALLFGNNYRYSYVSNGTVRGMECNRWDACITSDRSSYAVEYQWSDPALIMDMFGYTNERPVKMRMTGRVQAPQGSSEVFHIDSAYSVALFDDNPDLQNMRWAFEIPNSVYCEGFPSLKKPPNRLSSAYSLRVEATFQTSSKSRQEYVSTVKNWYDFYNKLTRVDSMTNPATVEFDIAGLVQVAVIRDFRAGVEYIIDKSLGNCTTMALNGDGYDTITTPDGQYTIKDPLFLLGITDAANLTYHGVKYARGLPCDVWAGHMDLDYDNGTIKEALLYEIYFLQSGWSEDAGVAGGDFPVPVFLSVHQDFSSDQLPEDVIMNLQQNIFKFEEQPPFASVYDITPCFLGHLHIRRFQMAFPGTFRNYLDDNPTHFTKEIRDSLILYLQIPIIRLQHSQVEFDETQDRLIYEFTLVDQPQVDMELPVYVGKPLDQVVDQLKESMDSLVIVIVNEQGTPNLMRAIKDSLQEMYDDDCHSRHTQYQPIHDLEPVPEDLPPSLADQPQTVTTEGGEREGSEIKGSIAAFLMEMHQWVRSSSEKIYSPGDMAGMAMGMLALGLLLGTVSMLVILRKMGLSSDMESIPLNSRRQ